MFEELIVFLNFHFELKRTNIKSVSGEILAEVPRYLVNWRDYLAALAGSGLPADPGLEPLSDLYLKHQPDEVLFQDLLAFQAEMRESLDRLIRERQWPEEAWRRLLRETEGVPVTLEAEGEGALSPTDLESWRFRFTYLPETYRLRLLLLLREMMLTGRLFNLGREAEGHFFFRPAGLGQPARIGERAPDLSLSEAAAVRLPAVLAAEAAEKLPVLLQSLVRERLPEALNRKLAEELPRALEREMAARLPEALNAAVEARLPEVLAEKVETKLPIALAIKVETRLPYALAAMVDKKLPEALAAEVADQLPSALAREVKTRYPEALTKAVAAKLPGALAAEVACQLPAVLEPAVESAFPEALAAKVAAEYPEALADKLNENLPVLMERRVVAELPALLQERVAEKYPETLAAAVADCLPEALAREVELKLPEALAREAELKLPEALARAVSGRLPEALAEAVASRLPGRLSEEVASRLPGALQVALEAEKPEAMAALEEDRNAALARAVAAALPETLAQAVADQLPERLAAEVARRWPEALEREVAERLPEALARAVEEKLPDALARAMEEKLPEVLESARETLAAVGLPGFWPPPVSEPVGSGESGSAGAASQLSEPEIVNEATEEPAAAGQDCETSPAERAKAVGREEAEEYLSLEPWLAVEAGTDYGRPDLKIAETGETEDMMDDEEPLLLTEAVTDGSDFESAGLVLNPVPDGEDDGWASAADFFGSGKEDEEDLEDESPILDLEPLAEKEETPEPPLAVKDLSLSQAVVEEEPETPDRPGLPSSEDFAASAALEPVEELSLRRPSPGQKNLEHRLATLEHRFRRSRDPDRTEDGKD